MSLIEKPAESPERKRFYDKINNSSYTALWTVLSDIITPEPRSACMSHLWHFDEAKSYLLEAGGLITAEEAERRVLVLENPGLRGQSRITTSLYAGLQVVMPGEVAPVESGDEADYAAWVASVADRPDPRFFAVTDLETLRAADAIARNLELLGQLPGVARRLIAQDRGAGLRARGRVRLAMNALAALNDPSQGGSGVSDAAVSCPGPSAPSA